MKRLLLLCIALSGALYSQAQMSAWVDYRNEFYIADNGRAIKKESLPPVSFAVGRVAIPYIDNARNFKIYANGTTEKINDGFTNSFIATDNLVMYRNSSAINVYENGQNLELSRLCDNYFVGDSVILYYDQVRSVLKGYYGGNTYELENFLAGDPASIVSVSDNIISYLNFANRFKIFYHGQVIDQSPYPVTQFKAGRNTVAYIDNNREFKIFYKGSTYDADDFPPTKFMVGDDLVAFISNDRHFKIFYDGQILDIGYYEPEFNVTDYVVAFEDANGYFQVFYKGKTYQMDLYYPKSMMIGYNSMAFIDRSNTLKMFSAGQIYNVTTAAVQEIRLDYDVLKYTMGFNMYKVFYKGQEFK